MILRVALGIAIAAFLALVILLIQQYKQIQRLDYIAAHRQTLFHSLRGSGPLTEANASTTASWMTFDYINRAFKLPSDYLRDYLKITDSRYPRLTIAELAEDTKSTQAATINQVTSAIHEFFHPRQ